MPQPWTFSSSNAKAYERVNEHYVEPEWVNDRLFEEERFTGAIYDPACGFGRVVLSALQAGHKAYGSDIEYRGWDSTPQDFFEHRGRHDNLVFNPPFDQIRKFTEHAVKLAKYKVATIFPTSRLNAARWLEDLPLHHVWLLTPRPSMPPGHVIRSGGKIGGGKYDFCWLVFSKQHSGTADIRWLHRDVELR